MLSEKQQKIIHYIRAFRLRHNLPPTVRDIMWGCNISSTSVVAYNLKILAKEGYLRLRPEISRGIELTEAIPALVEVPLLGKIAAGSPIPVPEADTWNPTASSETITVSPDLLQGKDKVFALQVKGNSMIDALINDGDIVFIQSQNMVENGEMAAVWLKAEKEVTLKKFYAEKARIRLQPANSQMKPIYTHPDNVEIQGKVIAVIRKLD